MDSVVVRGKPEKTVKVSTRQMIRNTAKEYASYTTIHGCSYIANSEHPIGGRIFWLFVVILALLITTFQLVSLHIQWETNPVITDLETIALPIEDIEFPAVTICPQGSVKDSLDYVMFYQLTRYARNKNEMLRSNTSPSSTSQLKEDDSWNVTYDEMLVWMDEFLRDVYPGAKDKPTKLVALMTSDDPQKALQNEAVVLPAQHEECNERKTREIINTLNKQLNNDFCPEGFTKFDNVGCVSVADSEMTYKQASDYCMGMDGSVILQLDLLDGDNVLGNVILNVDTHT